MHLRLTVDIKKNVRKLPNLMQDGRSQVSILNLRTGNAYDVIFLCFFSEG